MIKSLVLDQFPRLNEAKCKNHIEHASDKLVYFFQQRQIQEWWHDSLLHNQHKVRPMVTAWIVTTLPDCDYTRMMILTTHDYTMMILTECDNTRLMIRTTHDYTITILAQIMTTQGWWFSPRSWLHNSDSHRLWLIDDSHIDRDYTRMMILTQIMTTQQWFSQIVTNRWFSHRSWLHNGDDSHINHDYTMVIILTQIVTTWFSHRSWLHNDNDSHKNCDYTTTIVTTPDCDYTTTILTQIMTTQHHGSHIATQPPQFCDIDFDYPLAGSQFSYCRGLDKVLTTQSPWSSQRSTLHNGYNSHIHLS